MKSVALYCRVSTAHQTTDNQLFDLERVANARGWRVAQIYTDHALSGTKGRDGRPGLDAIMKDATRRRFDLIAVWSVDRLGRSLQHLVEIVNELHSVGVDLYIHQQAIDTSTPAGKLAFSVFGALAEYERTLIRDRVNAGLQRARQQGKVLGRPTNLTDDVARSIRALRAEGKPLRSIAAAARVGTSTVYRVLRSA